MADRIAAFRLRLRGAMRCPRREEDDLPTRDREISTNRLLFGLAAAAYIACLAAYGYPQFAALAAADAVYLALSLFVFVSIRRRSWKGELGRHLMLGADVAVVSAGFVVAGAMAAPILFLYIWVILGYGFRYGIYWLRLSAALSILGLLVALVCTGYWRTQPFVSAGLLLLALIVPPYFELLLRRTIRANEAAADANHAKLLMLAGLGHALRTPLHTILRAVPVAAGGGLDLKQRGALDTIRASAELLIGDLDNFLDVSRLDAGGMPKQVTSFGVPELLGELESLAGTGAAAKGLKLNWFAASDIPLRIWSERLYLLKTLTHLVENGVRFTASGSVLVTVCPMGRGSAQQLLRFEVLDTGMGVQPGARHKIFESFTQASPDIFHEFGGAGLGLYVARRMVSSLGGTIGVESHDGLGSTFNAEVPFEAAEMPSGWERALSGSAAIVLTPEASSLFPFASRIERLGVKVHLSAQPENWGVLLGEILADTDRIAVIIDGREAAAVEVARSLRESKLLDRLPLVLLTGAPVLPPPEARRLFRTSIGLDVPDQQLASALRIAGLARTAYPMPEEGEAAAQPGGREAKEPIPLRVLIADRSRSMGLVLSTIVELTGHTAVVVPTGEEMLDAAERGEVDLAFVDVDDEVVGGVLLTKLLRFQEVGRPHTPVYGLTVAINPATAQACQDAHMDGVLELPLDLSKVASILAERREEQAGLQPPPATVGVGIASITSHPRFKLNRQPPVKDDTYAYLHSIGGPGFVEQIASTFVDETAGTLDRLDQAIRVGNLKAYLTDVSSLAGAAAVIGAERLRELCRAVRDLNEGTLASEGPEHLARLRSEVMRVVGKLQDRKLPNARS